MSHSTLGALPHGTAERLELVIETLRESYICDGWRMDEAAAKRALAAVKGGAGSSFTDVIKFALDHGQSLDWLFGAEIGGYICRGASVSPRAKVLASATA